MTLQYLCWLRLRSLTFLDESNLCSYLGVFGKELVDGTADNASGSLQDILLLVALGVSVLIGVFASQLANETWESINEEVEKAKAAKGENKEDEVMRNFMGMDLPQWVIGFQLSLKAADKRVNHMIEEEYAGKVWNYTKEELEVRTDVIDPATLPNSPEILGEGKGFDFASSICDGLVLSPCLLGAYLKYADPLFDESKELEEKTNSQSADENRAIIIESSSTEEVMTSDGANGIRPADDSPAAEQPVMVRPETNKEATVDDLLIVLRNLRVEVEKQKQLNDV